MERPFGSMQKHTLERLRQEAINDIVGLMRAIATFKSHGLSYADELEYAIAAATILNAIEREADSRVSDGPAIPPLHLNSRRGGGAEACPDEARQPPTGCSGLTSDPSDRSG